MEKHFGTQADTIGVQNRRASTLRALRMRLPVFAVLLDYPKWSFFSIAVVIALGLWVYQVVRTSMYDIRSAGLATLLNTQVGALELWIEDQTASARQWANDPGVHALILDLVRRSESPGADARYLCGLPERRQLLGRLEPFVKDDRGTAVNVIDRSGRVLASRSDASCGRSVRGEFRDRLRNVFGGQTRFIAPTFEAERFDAPGALRAAVTWIVTPVADARGRVVAALGLGTFAAERFGMIFRASWLGRTGEAYAFDRGGRVLSEIRFPDEARSAGILSESGPAGALGMALVDPGRDLREQPARRGDASGGRPTRLVETALREGLSSPSGEPRGVLLHPYRNYLGAPVVGAWAWLPHHDFGVAIELGEEEAFGPLARISTVFAVVLGVLGLMAAVLLFSVLSVMRLHREVAYARRVGSYVLGREIGEGGMSTVFLAQHALLKRPTAVKVLKLHVATDEAIARFEREVQIASRLTHPNTIEIFDFGRAPNGAPFCAMEYVEGMTFADLVERHGPQSPARVAWLLRQVCGSLKEAHAHGLVHRDIKPHNLMLCRRGGELDFVKVLDFGLVKDTTSPGSRNLTKSLRILGTPLYMSPERIRDPSSADPRDDIYAAGAVGFYLLTGMAVFDSTSDIDVATQVLGTPPRRPSEAAAQPIPPELDSVLYRCLAKSRLERPQAIEELISIFDEYLLRDPWLHAAAEAWWDAHGVDSSGLVPEPALSEAEGAPAQPAP